MSLRNQPEFEQMETETTTTTTTETKERTMQETTTIDAGVAATTAIAKAATSAVGAAMRFDIAFKEYNNVLDTTTVESLSLAVPRLTGEQGSAMKSGEDIGSKFHFEIVSFNNRWVVGTGENDAESKEKFRVSLDHKTISGTGEDLFAYLESLKAEGFSKAKISPYIDIFGFITWSEKSGDIPPGERELCLLQCSQTSAGKFSAFCATRGLLQSKGVVKPISVVEVTAQKQQNKSGDRYTSFTFAAPKA